MAKKIKPPESREITSVSVKTFVDDFVYRIDLDADYQRETIWSREDQEMLIDSILQNIDIPKLYLARTRASESFDFECIDGKQRISALANFINPDSKETNPLSVRIAGERYTHKKLARDLPKLAKKIEDFELTLVIYPPLEDEEFLREIFRRLQLGVRLNSGELLKSYTGTLRDFVYQEMGKQAPFLRHTGLSDKRFSREFTLAQICINSFSKRATGNFVRARYEDLLEFFKDNDSLEDDDSNLVRVRTILELMDKSFGDFAQKITSRAVAVSAYLFVEEMHARKQSRDVPVFAEFFTKLLDEVKENLKLLSKFRPPLNPLILEEFQKHVSQASVEPSAIRRRHAFLEKAFVFYTHPKTKGRIIRVLS